MPGSEYKWGKGDERSFWIALAVFALVVGIAPVACSAEEPERSGIQSLGVRVVYGIGDRHDLVFASLLPRISLFLPRLVDEPLRSVHVQAEYVLEPIASYVTDKADTLELGVNPLFLSLRYDRGQVLVPFVEGGEGLLYSNLRGERLGTHFQFSSQAGGGLHWFLGRTVALTLSGRIRHISNAGLTRENSGLNTYFVGVGVSLFPKR